ncbi:IS66 family insertion sequence element accessory protein TnpB [Pseudomonas yamanorum]|uniref:IS66 family insertion sequence element accessory protein TnpB n=1 Tax=Pseudomonas yamanorum TaxID=515393 RepID=UPI0021125284|nr:IS66 family insertion sequence element accessory protein TnpB [Pseudomonas yamanorum]
MIRIDSIWFATEPMDMRAGTETALARVIAVFGAAKPHCAYLFANRRATRMKVLVHDGFGIWLAARRLTKASSTGLAFAMVLRWNWMPSNFKPWYWVCHGNAQVLEARSYCFNGCN